MQLRNVPVLALAGSAAAFGGPFKHRKGGPFAGGQGQGSQIPDVCAPWASIASDLMNIFVDSEGLCTSDARQGIRMQFHDCWPGVCDGSMMLSDECTTRSENQQMVPMCNYLQPKVQPGTYGGGDMINLAASLGTAVCMGPIPPFFIGRPDSYQPNPANQIPTGNSSAEEQIANFQAKGFSPEDLAAVLGAHSTATTLSGVPLDSTVTDWDVLYYSETFEGTAPASLPSDQNVAHYSETAASWQAFANSDALWEAMYLVAITRLGTLGNDVSTLTDCTAIVTNAMSNRRRSVSA